MLLERLSLAAAGPADPGLRLLTAYIRRLPERDGDRPGVRRRLGTTEVGRICAVIDAWPGGERVTWQDVVERSAGLLGHEWTRQALERHPEIKAAYQRRRDALRDGAAPRVPADPAEVVRERQIAALLRQVQHLEERLAEYELRFARHEYNAQAHGVAPSELDSPLQPIDRGRTDD